jgi:hypothetical protein
VSRQFSVPLEVDPVAFSHDCVQESKEKKIN